MSCFIQLQLLNLGLPNSTVSSIFAVSTLFRKWRRGDSNPKRTETEPLHVHDNSATDCSEKPLEACSKYQNHDTSEHFETISQHKFGANMVREDGGDTELTRIVAAWAELPKHTKVAIKALVDTHNSTKA